MTSGDDNDRVGERVRTSSFALRDSLVCLLGGFDRRQHQQLMRMRMRAASDVQGRGRASRAGARTTASCFSHDGTCDRYTRAARRFSSIAQSRLGYVDLVRRATKFVVAATNHSALAVGSRS